MEIETSFYRAGAAAEHPAQQDTETDMNANQDNVKTFTTIEEQINSIRMPQYEREAALHYARIGAGFTEAIVQVCEKFARAQAEIVMKSGRYYWE